MTLKINKYVIPFINGNNYETNDQCTLCKSIDNVVSQILSLQEQHNFSVANQLIATLEKVVVDGYHLIPVLNRLYTSIAQYKLMIDEYNKNKEQYNNKETISSARDGINKSTEYIQYLQEEIKNINTKITKLYDKKRETNIEIQNYSDAIVQYEDKINQYSNNIQPYTDEINNCRYQIDIYKEQINNLETAINVSNEQINYRLNQLNLYNYQLEQLNQSLYETNVIINNYYIKISEKNDEINTCKLRIKQINQRKGIFSNLNLNDDKIEFMIEEINKNIIEYEKDIDNIKKMIQEYNEIIIMYLDGINAYNDEIAELQRIINLHKDDMSELEEQLGTCENEIQELTNKINSIQDKISSHNLYIDNCNKSIQELNNKINELILTKNELTDKINILETEILEYKQIINTYNERISEYNDIIKNDYGNYVKNINENIAKIEGIINIYMTKINSLKTMKTKTSQVENRIYNYLLNDLLIDSSLMKYINEKYSNMNNIVNDDNNNDDDDDGDNDDNNSINGDESTILYSRFCSICGSRKLDIYDYTRDGLISTDTDTGTEMKFELNNGNSIVNLFCVLDQDLLTITWNDSNHIAYKYSRLFINNKLIGTYTHNESRQRYVKVNVKELFPREYIYSIFVINYSFDDSVLCCSEIKHVVNTNYVVENNDGVINDLEIKQITLLLPKEELIILNDKYLQSFTLNNDMNKTQLRTKIHRTLSTDELNELIWQDFVLNDSYLNDSYINSSYIYTDKVSQYLQNLFSVNNYILPKINLNKYKVDITENVTNFNLNDYNSIYEPSFLNKHTHTWVQKDVLLISYTPSSEQTVIKRSLSCIPKDIDFDFTCNLVSLAKVENKEYYYCFVDELIENKERIDKYTLVNMPLWYFKTFPAMDNIYAISNMDRYTLWKNINMNSSWFGVEIKALTYECINLCCENLSNRVNLTWTDPHENWSKTLIYIKEYDGLPIWFIDSNFQIDLNFQINSSLQINTDLKNDLESKNKDENENKDKNKGEDNIGNKAYLIYESLIENQHREKPLLIDGLKNGKNYQIGIFPCTKDGIICMNPIQLIGQPRFIRPKQIIDINTINTHTDITDNNTGIIENNTDINQYIYRYRGDMNLGSFYWQNDCFVTEKNTSLFFEALYPLEEGGKLHFEVKHYYPCKLNVYINRINIFTLTEDRQHVFYAHNDTLVKNENSIDKDGWQHVNINIVSMEYCKVIIEVICENSPFTFSLRNIELSYNDGT